MAKGKEPQLDIKKFIYKSKYGQGKAWRYLLRNYRPNTFWLNEWDKLNSDAEGYFWHRQKGTTHFYYEIVSFDENKYSNRNNIPYVFDDLHRPGLCSPKKDWANKVREAFKKFERLFNIKFHETSNLLQPSKGDKSARRLRIFFSKSGFENQKCSDEKGNIIEKEVLGRAYLPGGSLGGDIYLAVKKKQGKYQAVDQHYMLHEIGHALGLTHPFMDKNEEEVFAKLGRKLPPDNPFNSNYFTMMAYGDALRSGIGAMGVIALSFLFGVNPVIAAKFIRYKMGYEQQSKKLLMYRQGHKTKSDPLYGKDNAFNWGAIIGPDAYILDGYEEPEIFADKATKCFAVYLNAQPNSFSGLCRSTIELQKVDGEIQKLSFSSSLEKDFLMQAWYNVSRKIKILISGYAGGVLIGHKNTKFIKKKSRDETLILPGQKKNICIFENDSFEAEIDLTRSKIKKNTTPYAKIHKLTAKDRVFVCFPNLNRKFLTTKREGGNLIIKHKKKDNCEVTLLGYFTLEPKIREKMVRIFPKEVINYNPKNYYISSKKGIKVRSYRAVHHRFEKDFENVEVKPKTDRVPIILGVSKLKDPKSGIKFQVSANCQDLIIGIGWKKYLDRSIEARNYDNIIIKDYVNNFHKFGIYDRDLKIVAGVDRLGTFHFSDELLPNNIVVSKTTKLRNIKIKDIAREFIDARQLHTGEIVLTNEGRTVLKIKGYGNKFISKYGQKATMQIFDCIGRPIHVTPYNNLQLTQSDNNPATVR